MSIWQHHSDDEKIVMLQQTAAARKIIEQAVEKDWWVSTVLMALSTTSWAGFLQFKGGTSLSKSWGLINRFSEDIDMSVSRSFFGLNDDTPQQRTAIRRKAFHYIEKNLIGEIDKALNLCGIEGYEIQLVTKNSSAMVTTLELKYQTILTTIIEDILPVIKVESHSLIHSFTHLLKTEN